MWEQPYGWRCSSGKREKLIFTGGKAAATTVAGNSWGFNLQVLHELRAMV